MVFSTKILFPWSIPKFRKKFLERPPTNLYSPNTKWNFRSKFRFLDPFPNSGKNFSRDLLPTYVLLIQNRKIGQKFRSIKNFKNSRNLTSFPRIWRPFPRISKIPGKISRAISYQLMFSQYKITKLLIKNFDRSKISRNFSFPRISEILRIWTRSFLRILENF